MIENKNVFVHFLRENIESKFLLCKNKVFLCKNVFDAKMYLMQKCIFAQENLFCNINFYKKYIFVKMKIPAFYGISNKMFQNVSKNLFLHQIYFCIKHIFASAILHRKQTKTQHYHFAKQNAGKKGKKKDGKFLFFKEYMRLKKINCFCY